LAKYDGLAMHIVAEKCSLALFAQWMELITTRCNKQETFVLGAYAQKGTKPMSTEQNKINSQRLFEDIGSQGNPDLIN
jgi:hypothetical protein